MLGFPHVDGRKHDQWLQPDRITGMTAGRTWLSALAGLLAGAITALAPFIYYWSAQWHPLQTAGVPYFSILLGPVVAGGLVTVLVGGSRPRWWLGAVLGVALGAVAAGFYFGKGGDVPKELWLQTLLSLCFIALAAVAGGVGGLAGWGVHRLLLRGSHGRATRRGLPWKVGVVIMVVAALVFGVLAAVV